MDNGQVIPTTLGVTDYLNFAIIILVPFVIGCISLMLLEKVKKERWLSAFGIYRIVVGIAILVVGYLL